MLQIRRLLSWALPAILGLIALAFIAIITLSYTVSRPRGLGVTAGRLAPCPATPNCVSTQADNPSQKIEPIPYTTSMAEAKQRLLTVIQATPRTTIIEDSPTYLAVVFRSALLRFPDDVEFYFDEPHKLIHFRSASRLGQGDLGVNRARMVALTKELEVRN